jgi:hypothetical protein
MASAQPIGQRLGGVPLTAATGAVGAADRAGVLRSGRVALPVERAVGA